MGQFLIESLLYTLLAIILSLGLIAVLIPAVNTLLELDLEIAMLGEPSFFFALLAVVGLVGILAGAYPAFFLSAFEPIAVLKGKYTKGSGKNPLRKALVVIQFTISLFLLIGTGIIYDQLNYVRTKDLGFDKEHLITIPFTHSSQRDKWPVFRESLLQNPNILSAATASSSPGRGIW